jgi:KaiC/GvpD/RAD55 family RecA-like ATPase
MSTDAPAFGALPPSHQGHEHIVQFYGSDRSLVRTVATFLSEGLVAGEPAIVIATTSHCAAIITALGERLIDCDRAVRSGDLILFDAEATLDLFLVGDTPNPDLFEANVGRLIEQAVNGRRTRVRAYGEMVDVLWKQARPEAAIKLEILWNKLALKHDFALLCGYAMGSFYKQSAGLEEVIAQHTRVIGNDASVVPFHSRSQRSSRV